MFPWIPWSFSMTEAFPMKHSPFESSQAAGLLRLMVPNCCAICSCPPRSQLFSDRPAARLITSHIVKLNPDTLKKALMVICAAFPFPFIFATISKIWGDLNNSAHFKQNTKLKRRYVELKPLFSFQTCISNSLIDTVSQVFWNLLYSNQNSWCFPLRPVSGRRVGCLASNHSLPPSTSQNLDFVQGQCAQTKGWSYMGLSPS